VIVAWTGHRPNLFRDPVAAQATVARVARELVQGEAAARFLVGGQRGVDTWAALAAITLHIPFAVILPLPLEQFVDVHEVHDGWTSAERAQLEQTLAAAADVRTVGGERLAAFTARNHALARRADVLVAVWTGTPGGGTAETIELAHAHGTPVRELILEPSSHAVSPQGRGV
jgi:uncharacterized phage-like protein YoqJ